MNGALRAQAARWPGGRAGVADALAWVDEPHHMGKATTTDKGSTNEAATHPSLIRKSIPPGQDPSSPRSENQQTQEIDTIAQISQTKESKKHLSRAQEDTNCRHASASSRGAQGTQSCPRYH